MTHQLNVSQKKMMELHSKSSQQRGQVGWFAAALAQNLASVYDAHHVCATTAQLLHERLGMAAIVGLRSTTGPHFNVWCSGIDGLEAAVTQLRWDGPNSLLDDAIASGVPALWERGDFSAESLAEHRFWQYAEQTMWCVPFGITDGSVVYSTSGVILLPDQTPSDVISAEQLQTMAALVNIFVDRALLHQRQAAQAVYSEVIRSISNELTSTLSIDEILDTVANPVRAVLDVASISIGLIDPETEDIVFVKTLMGPLFEELPLVRLEKGAGIVGWVVENNQSIIINDVYRDQRFYTRIDQQSGFRTEQVACVPLRTDNHVIGVLEAINKQTGRFDHADLFLLEALASPLAIALRNAQLHDTALADKRRIETVFSRIAEGMLLLDDNGQITDVNEAMCALLRADATELIGRTIDEIIMTQSGLIIDFFNTLVQQNAKIHNLTSDIRSGHGQWIPVLISGTAITDETGAISEIILVFSDLRPVREVERMREDFFHNIIHELRTPLATILMYARLLRDRKGSIDAEHENRWLEIIEHESDRLQSMIRQMMAVAQRQLNGQRDQIKLINLNEMFAELAEPMADMAQIKGVTLVNDIQADLPTISADYDELYYAFKNLLENAVKFTPHGKIELSAWVEDCNQIVVRVRDQGIGIPDEAIPNLFKRFYRAQTAVDSGMAGTGLGLYMVAECIQRYGGSIDVISEVGKGSTFVVTLPTA